MELQCSHNKKSTYNLGKGLGYLEGRRVVLLVGHFRRLAGRRIIAAGAYPVRGGRDGLQSRQGQRRSCAHDVVLLLIAIARDDRRSRVAGTHCSLDVVVLGETSLRCVSLATLK